MAADNNNRVCPVELSGSLDNLARKLVQNPRKILKPYISEGMTVMDLGCGPGFFTIEIAKMLNNSGKIVAVDLQQGMLEKVKDKIKGTSLEKRIELHKCQEEKIGIEEKFDFVLAFYMVHEVPDQDKLFNEVRSQLNPLGKFLIVEPKFHVSSKSFEEMIHRSKTVGFEIADRPKVFFSRAVLLT